VNIGSLMLHHAIDDVYHPSHYTDNSLVSGLALGELFLVVAAEDVIEGLVLGPPLVDISGSEVME